MLSPDQITIDRGNGIEVVEKHTLDGPFISIVDNDNEHTTVTEYRLNGLVVHRSAHVRLKKGLGIEGILGQLR